MKVLVYVEGPSDRTALDALLRDLIEQARSLGVGITFHPQGGKDAVLERVPHKAAHHLAQHPEDLVLALPDLYPMAPYRGTPYEHTCFEQLRDVVRNRFEQCAARLRLAHQVRGRFRVHCLKHDLEALLLACPTQLRQRLGTKEKLRDAWRKPVEEQNDERPPKRVVEALFRKYRKRQYVDTIDAPWILQRADLDELERACPQRFRPFAAELRAVLAGVSASRSGPGAARAGGS